MAQDFRDVPPPPYSETDIYSSSGGARSGFATAGAAEGASTHSDNNSQHAADERSVTSSSEVIYTPQLSPAMSPVISNGSHFTQQQQVAAAPISSQATFFASRPVPPRLKLNRSEIPLKTYNLLRKRNSGPDDFPHPGREWTGHYDVSEDDWQTFLNFLFPHHAMQRTEAVIDRKLRDEQASSGSQHSSSASVAHLEGARPDRAAAAPAIAEDPYEAWIRETDTVSAWNDEFFGPRGVNVSLEYGQSLTTLLERSRDFAKEHPEAMDQETREATRLHKMSGGDITAAMEHMGIHDHQHGMRGRLNHDIHGRDGALHRHAHRRSHSADSSSSSSSSSSSDSDASEASVGSLPDYDDLQFDQIPVAKAGIQAWLNHPEQPITKASVKNLAAQIKAAKKPGKQSIKEPMDKAELAAAKKEVKALLQQWKSLKKSQKQAARSLRRDKKNKRRAEKRERREVRREMKKARKEGKREARRERRHGRGGRHGRGEEGPAQQQPGGAGSGGFVPYGVVPGVPRVPGVEQPAVPAPMCGPRGGPGGFGWWGGNGYGRGGCGGPPLAAGRGGGPFGGGRGRGGWGRGRGSGVFSGFVPPASGFGSFFSGNQGGASNIANPAPPPVYDPRGPSGAPGAWPEDEKTPTKPTTSAKAAQSVTPSATPATAATRPAPQKPDLIRDIHDELTVHNMHLEERRADLESALLVLQRLGGGDPSRRIKSTHDGPEVRLQRHVVSDILKDVKELEQAGKELQMRGDEAYARKLAADENFASV